MPKARTNQGDLESPVHDKTDFCSSRYFPAVHFRPSFSSPAQSAYHAIFHKLNDLIPEFAPATAMADFEEASASAEVQSIATYTCRGVGSTMARIVKCLTKMRLKDAYKRQTHVKDLVRCVLGLPLLPPGDMLQALQEIRSTIHDDDEFSRQIQVRYFPVLHFQRPRHGLSVYSQVTVRDAAAAAAAAILKTRYD